METVKVSVEELYQELLTQYENRVIYFVTNKYFDFINDNGYLKIKYKDGSYSKAKIKMDKHYQHYSARIANKIWEEETLNNGRWLEDFSKISLETYFNSIIWSYSNVHPVIVMIKRVVELGEIISNK